MRLLYPPHAGEGGGPEGEVHRFAMVAIQHVTPRDLGGIPVEKIMAIKTTLDVELTAFRDLLDQQRLELQQYAAMGSDVTRAEALTKHFDQQIRKPLDRLERSWAQLGIETARSLLTMQSFAPPAAV